MTTRHVRIDSERVVHDTSDGEVLAIRADTGAYYSMDGSAATIWDAIAAGHDEAGIVRDLSGRYTVDEQAAQVAVGSLLDQLLEEALVVSHAEPAAPVDDARVPGEPAPWVEPLLQKYTDMQDLLLFDPIHEVGPEGWPSVDPDAR